MRIELLLVLMVEALVILFVAKLARDRVLKRNGVSVNERVVKQASLGTAISQVGYLIGILLGFLGAISFAGQAASFVSMLGHLALFGLLAVALQLVADILSDRLIFRGIAQTTDPNEDDNISLALGKAGVSVATGLVLRGAMADPMVGIFACVAWFIVGQALMVLAVLFYCRLTPYDDLAEIRRRNVAASFPIVGILLAVGLVVEAAVSTKGNGELLPTVLHVGKFLGVSLVLVYVFRLIANRVFLPKLKLSTAIAERRNLAAGLQEGVAFLLVSLIVIFFLS
jgi:uncharacterized membrane protein YjfL (UPF0719 family)